MAKGTDDADHATSLAVRWQLRGVLIRTQSSHYQGGAEIDGLVMWLPSARTGDVCLAQKDVKRRCQRNTHGIQGNGAGGEQQDSD